MLVVGTIGKMGLRSELPRIIGTGKESIETLVVSVVSLKGNCSS